MKINFDAPDEWAERLDALAKQDGHSNRSAVIRKIVTLFFAGKVTFCCPEEKEHPCQEKAK